MWRSWFLLFLMVPTQVFSEASVSPSLFFARENLTGPFIEKAADVSTRTASVTLRFDDPPDASAIAELESRGVTFARENGRILHSRCIYPATILLHSLESVSQYPGVVRIEHSYRPSAPPTLNVSNPEVQASKVWFTAPPPSRYDGSGVVIVNIDTGVDIFHPGLFKADGGTYSWSDVNGNGVFDSGIDCVDLNGNGRPDANELLRFYDAPCQDALNLIERTDGVYDADLDWLYNDANGNGVRDYGPGAGFTETDPCYGERIFIVEDSNRSSRLDPGEILIGLGTSKVRAIFDKNGKHVRGVNLFTNTGDTTHHGTASTGVLGGQHPGRRLTGMAPGAEFICINRLETDNLADVVLQTKSMGAKIFMYEYGSWVYEFLDGSSNLETLIDDLYAEGFHQFTASGNLAGPTRKKHAFTTITANTRKSILFTVPDIGIKEVYISILWRGKNPRPTLTMKLPDSTTAPIAEDQVKRTYKGFSVLSGIDYSSRATSRVDILITSNTSFSGAFSLEAYNGYKSDVGIHTYIADNVTQWNNGAQFLDYVTDDGTICSPGTALSGITVGAYDPRGTRNQKGDINDFSSRGKTIDGRRGVDITAPGTLVYSLASHYPSNGAPGGYFEFGGTSSALPHVTGCAALLAQASPGISPDSLSWALLGSALGDAFTGLVPNDTWGYGKLRIFNTFSGLHLVSAGISDSSPGVFSVSEGYPNPFNAVILFQITLPASPKSHLIVSIHNVLGQRVFSRTFTNLPAGQFQLMLDSRKDFGKEVSSGHYFATFTFYGYRVSRKLILLK